MFVLLKIVATVVATCECPAVYLIKKITLIAQLIGRFFESVPLDFEKIIKNNQLPYIILTRL